MPVSDLLLEGVTLMLLGMGMVFVFLTLLVLAMNLMSRLALALQPAEEVAAVAEPVKAAAPPASATGSDDLIAVISAAIARYRADHR